MLEDTYDTAMQLVLMLFKNPGCRKQHSRMTIMSAGMHDTIIDRAEFQLIFFLDRKGINIGTDSNRLSRICSVDNSHNTSFHRSSDVLYPCRFQFPAEKFCRLIFLK